jgi:hypothetical protein
MWNGWNPPPAGKNQPKPKQLTDQVYSGEITFSCHGYCLPAQDIPLKPVVLMLKMRYTPLKYGVLVRIMHI